MPKDLADTLRAAIKTSGKSARTLAGETGIPQSTISRFLSGTDMKLSNASVLAKHLGLELKNPRNAR